MKKYFTTLAVITIVLFSCKKKDSLPPPTEPLVTTAALTNVSISSGTATAGGAIVSDGGAAITQSGIVWSKTNATPTKADSVIAGTTATGTFTTALTGLDFGKTYYFRAFATNSVGTGYGSVVTLITSSDSVKFTYNGQTVTYGIITSPTTGKKWLDRNLGAKQVATASNDFQAYGDLFQWGRPADGHQLMNWTASDAGTAVNGTTNVLATTDIPGHNNFIMFDYDNSTTGDWRSDNNRNRWATNPQGPCPAGWHVPSTTEWLAEVSKTKGGTANSGGIIDRNTAYSQLKLTVAGLRYVDGPGVVRLSQQGRFGHYWPSSDELSIDGYTYVRELLFGDGAQQYPSIKGYAMCVRCLKD